MQQPKISVIVPVYNVEKYLKQCLDSIVNQTYKNLEIIIVNDGTKDNSMKIVENYLQDNRIKVINKENGGLASARNSGLEKVTGKYISFIDSDDWIELNMYEELVSQINDEDILIYRYFSYDDKKKKIVGKKKIDFYSQNKLEDKYLYVELPCCCWSKLYKKEYLEKNNFKFLEILYEDVFWNIETIFSTEKIKFIDKRFPERLLDKLYRDGKLELCTFQGKNDSEYKLSLNLYPSYEKEGEFTLVCYNFEDKPLAKLTFGFLEDSIIIGGLQGLEKGEDTNLIKEATKNMYGVFPKRLVLEILYLLFPEYRVLGVSREKHIYFSDHYRKRKEGKVHANYDEFWASLDGEEKDGMWLLPKKLERKNIEEIPSKKRSLYQNRFNLLDSIFERILRNIE